MTSVSSSRGGDVGGGAEGAADESLAVAADEGVAEAAGGVFAAAGPATVMGSTVGGHDGGEAEVGVLPGVLVDVSTLAVELDLYRVSAVQDDDPGLLDDEALVDERFNPRTPPGELVAELVQEATKCHQLTRPASRGLIVRSDRRHVVLEDAVESVCCCLQGTQNVTEVQPCSRAQCQTGRRRQAHERCLWSVKKLN